nr:AAA family ATPase [uncultured Rhodopila sp.]
MARTMRLVELTVRNFRGFGSAGETIRLDRDLVLFFGPNGFGKTSLAEGIEWLFYGFTKRRRQGDAYSKAEYAGTYANAHRGKPVQVDLKVIIAGKEYLLSRRLIDGERTEATETFIDGVKAHFSTICAGSNEAVYPVVAQHGLQTFIHSKPKDRRDAIGAALGLDELTTLKTALESARSSFQRMPPASILDARKELGANLPALALLPDASELTTRWQRTPMQVQAVNDTAVLLKVATRLCGVRAATVDEALAALRTKRSEATKAIFDATKIAPAATAATDLKTFADSADTVNVDFGEFVAALSGAIAALAATYNAALLDFWGKGLALAPADEVCPMCEAPTLTTAKRVELQKRIAAGAAAIASDKTFAAKTAAVSTALTALNAAAVKCCTKLLQPSDRVLLRTLLKGSEPELDAFLTVYDALYAAETALSAQTKAATDYLRAIPSQVVDGSNAPQLLADAATTHDAVAQAGTGFKTAVTAYQDHWTAFERLLSAHIATQDAVARIDAVGKTLRSVTAMKLHEKYETLLADTQEVIRNVEAVLQLKQKALLTTRGGEVKTLYDMLNPGANVVFQGMEPGTDQMKLHAASFGVQMPAAANLSECQLNCLGLSVWVMQATTTGSPFGFIVLDDPVQAMDDDHAEAFLSTMVPYLIDGCGKQVIVLSHVQNITDRLQTINLSRPHRYFHLDNYAQTGPVVTEQARIAKMLAHIKGCAQGNVGNREHAVDRLRVLIELLIRELHLIKVGTPAPGKYDNATTGELLKLFRTIPGTTPQEHGALADTVGFADPAHHSQVGYSTPLATAINPHIDRVSGLLRRYGLLT